MKLLSGSALALCLANLPATIAWGSLGHITTAYLASHFVSNATEAHLKELLYNEGPDYIAKIASWADSIRYTDWGRYTKTFHFIDAHDSPPEQCNVDFERDCKDDGCVITALANYTKQSLEPNLPFWQRNQAAKFVVHFVGDLHQPLHNENVEKGGNGLFVRFDGRHFNLHHVWDSSIAEKLLGGLHGDPFELAGNWARQLAVEITDGRFAEEKETWLKDLNFNDPVSTALAWSREANALVCTHVLPEGAAAIVGQELGGEYFEKAAPVIERQVALAGYRMAAWLDHIVETYNDVEAEQAAGEL
ncbi:hypothetical protein LCI18_002327 [Fusarium solani-melongenae]|uniref:Uncharacterized protein n=1 Tax=Fusarium solani subsp. cucurbitae TaxID=2747967 RepID=A0ACD3YQZ2_FUSSC|nr:hypothetical protein LCI18_002327 [Fusarium solani-melongenae]